MIKDFLAEYYEARGTNPVYTALRSIVIDNHEIAWMEFKGSTGDEKTPYSERALYCECNFAKGVGWKIEDGRFFNLDNPNKCLYRRVALHLRHLELQREYLEKFGVDLFFVQQHIPEIIFDLIEKVKSGEFLEDGNGAKFWGGYFYLQTVAKITEQPIETLWEEINILVKNKKISIEGAVIQSYQEPPPESWQEFWRCELDSWVGIALLPESQKMAREWKLEVLTPDGKPAYENIPGLPLTYDPIFGPDVSDVVSVKKKIKKLILNAIAKSKKKK